MAANMRVNAPYRSMIACVAPKASDEVDFLRDSQSVPCALLLFRRALW